MGITISREAITIVGRFGTIYCKQYWIEPGDREFAVSILRGRSRIERQRIDLPTTGIDTAEINVRGLA